MSEPVNQSSEPLVPARPGRLPGRIFPYRVVIEQRLATVPWWYTFWISFLSVFVALLIGAGIIALAGGNPWASYVHIAKASFGDMGVFSDTIVKAIPLMIVGLACALAFRMRLWNIGAEGQFYVGAFGASAVVLIPLLPETAPRWLFIILMMAAGMLFGAIWGFVPGYLKSKFGVNEIISTLMMNYIAVAWNDFFIYAVWSESGFQMSKVFPNNAWLPRLSDLSASIPAFRGLTTHFGLVLALILAFVVWFLLYRSRWGYEIRLIGDNPHAAHYSGISTSKNIILVMMASGAIAGLAGMSEITGVVHRLQGAISPGYGFTGIIVAWLAKLNPLAVVFVSILFGALILAGREIQPSGIPKLIQGVILVCLIAGDYFLRYRVRIVRRTEEK
jgi:general nucleoside transport system permease protein